MIKQSGSVDHVRGRFYPVAYWSKPEVMKYAAAQKLKISPEAAVLGHSFRSFAPEEMIALRKHYPEDYARVVKAFPLVGASTAKAELYGTIQAKGKTP